jgi:hypothetical protein
MVIIRAETLSGSMNPMVPISGHADGAADAQKHTLVADVPSAGSRADFESAITQSTSQTYRWPLAQGVLAEARIVGAELQPEYFDALRQYLALAKKLLKPVFQEGNTVEYVDAYTGETRYGTIERMYGGNAVVRPVTKEEAGANPKRFADRAKQDV